MTQAMNGYQEAVLIVNNILYGMASEPTMRAKGIDFDINFTQQWEKRSQLSLTNDEIKTRLEALNEIEHARKQQVREWEAGTRKRITLGAKVVREQTALEQELGASLFYHAGKNRFEAIW